jgi:hypothetical protein
MANIFYTGYGTNIVYSGGGGASSSYEFVTNTTDTTITLGTSAFNKAYLIENASDVVITLPSIGTSDIGNWIYIYKMGAGDVTINRADSDTIEDGTSVANTTAAQTWANIKLIVATSTKWKMEAVLGSWSTS